MMMDGSGLGRLGLMSRVHPDETRTQEWTG
jgi:hypothetical protein